MGPVLFPVWEVATGLEIEMHRDCGAVGGWTCARVALVGVCRAKNPVIQAQATELAVAEGGRPPAIRALLLPAKYTY